jgi:hypothetical protein
VAAFPLVVAWAAFPLAVAWAAFPYDRQTERDERRGEERRMEKDAGLIC